MVIPHILYQTTLFHQEINVILNLLKVHEYLKKKYKIFDNSAIKEKVFKCYKYYPGLFMKLIHNDGGLII
jgi:hypothetical protein